MASDPDLLAAVASGLSVATSLGYDSQSAAHDLYEAYVLTLLLEAARGDSWNWVLRDQSCNITKHAVFRKGPGRLPTGNFTHALLTRPDKQSLEAHIGVKVRGKSNISHEFDLLVLPSSAAQACRTSGADPTWQTVRGHAEAKYYAGDLPLPLGRAAVGLERDCSLSGKSVVVTNQNGPTVEQLVTHYGIAFRFLIKPSNSAGLYYARLLFREILRNSA